MTDNNPDIEAAKEAALAYVAENPGTSFVELERELDEYIPVKGETSLMPPGDPKINMWVGVSEEFYAVIKELLADTDAPFYPHPCSPMVYYLDGAAPDLDIAKRPPAGGYKTERWLPTAFFDEPYEESWLEQDDESDGDDRSDTQ